MKNTLIFIGLAFLMSCNTASIKLTIPEAFKQQATMEHVTGAGGRKMSFANFSTSKIKRGFILPTGSENSFYWENIVLNQFSLQKDVSTVTDKSRYRYTLSDGKNQVHVYAQEKEITKHLEYKPLNKTGFLTSYEQLQQYDYSFSVNIRPDTAQSKNWVLQMTNIYDRQAEHDHNPFAHHKMGDEGLVTNGTDTIFIKPIKIQKSVSVKGVERQIPFKILSGYELSTGDGVIAIIDLIDHNIWFYNELDAAEKLNISAIATAIFARKIHNEKWANNKVSY